MQPISVAQSAEAVGGGTWMEIQKNMKLYADQLSIEGLIRKIAKTVIHKCKGIRGTPSKFFLGYHRSEGPAIAEG